MLTHSAHLVSTHRFRTWVAVSPSQRTAISVLIFRELLVITAAVNGHLESTAGSRLLGNALYANRSQKRAVKS